jgi:hypothetical protein
MNLYDQTVAYVDAAFGGRQKPHFTRAVYWFEQFLPQATEAQRIAAYAHDIERAFRDETKTTPDDYLDPEFLRQHQEKGAEIMAEFLQHHGASAEVITAVTHLISHHEIGGDADQNALMDADSISFFETNAEMFVTEKAPVEGYAKVKEKLDWMFNRISTDEHKALAQENYQRWSNELLAYK